MRRPKQRISSHGTAVTPHVERRAAIPALKYWRSAKAMPSKAQRNAKFNGRAYFCGDLRKTDSGCVRWLVGSARREATS
jgi:hypothetical protein